MKKLLLGTTTLIGAASLLAGAAFADSPKVTVGGYANFEAGYTNDNLDTHTTVHPDGANQRPQAFRNDTQINFKIDGKSDSGLGYGGEVDLLADTSTDVQRRGFNASKTFIYTDGDWGRFELGTNVGADSALAVNAGTIARATGGINGDWSYFANAANQYLAAAELPLQYGVTGVNSHVGYVTAGGAAASSEGNQLGDHQEENLSKVTYYTPRFAGFQLGVSYLPDQTNTGQGSATPAVPNPFGPNRTTGNDGLSANIFTGGVNYDNKFGDVGTTLAVTGEWGHAQDSTYENLAAWEAGGKLAYMGFSLAGSYGSWGSSNQLKADHANNSHYWDVGGAYEYGPFATSLTYLNSQFSCGTAIDAAGGANGDCAAAGTNKFQNTSLGVDYKLAPGLTPYAEVSYYNENAPGTATDNKGYVGIVGTQLNF
ncbi:MAG: porin [Pseudomonadota bacterium]|nr:porin [Pseudomonadota bacterium]MDE3036982.1 porin [Pseudomonadota bacterium]